MDGDRGALLVGSILSTLSCGVSAYQAAFYFFGFHDGTEVALWVVGAWLFNTATVFLSTALTYAYLITHFNDPVYSILEDPCTHAASMTTACTVLLVQSFFISRIWKLSTQSTRTLAMLAVFAFLALFAFATSIAKVYFSITRRGASSVTEGISKTNVSVEALLDILISLCLIYIPRQRDSEFPRAENPLTRLTMFLATRAILLAMYQTVLVIVPSVLSRALLSVAFEMLLGAAYLITMLFILNNRIPKQSESSGSRRLEVQTTIQFADPMDDQWSPVRASSSHNLRLLSIRFFSTGRRAAGRRRDPSTGRRHSRAQITVFRPTFRYKGGAVVTLIPHPPLRLDVRLST
ncbi:hypothetical protein BV25DRAFT_944620 [Artomyces pyxidatus]|uniref:Uncharacterized protein n=1 Tax=Artomyces pyxidatus TaxID=48021 RepID=A0ACB8SW07_9AGAM|nr:hypothetical protein BV25DRAFT_944620 [Artomyces pyxidatus]